MLEYAVLSTAVPDLSTLTFPPDYSSHLFYIAILLILPLLYYHFPHTMLEYAVLSTAVPDLSTLGQNVNDRWEVPHLCQAGFSDWYIPITPLQSHVQLIVTLMNPNDSISFSIK